MDMKHEKALIVLDLETTGIWIEKDKIIEVALIRCHTDGSREVYAKRVNPGIPIPKHISQIIGIKDEDIKDAPFFKEIAKEVHDFIGDSDLAGYNLERMDLPLLEREFSEAGYSFDWKKRKIFDAQKVFHLNEKRDLTTAYKY
jgi:DNA polymerase III subunit epsilon